MFRCKWIAKHSLMANIHYVIRFGHLIAEMLLLETTQRYGSIVEVGFYRGLPGPSKFSSNATPPSRRSSRKVQPEGESSNPVGESIKSIQPVHPKDPSRKFSHPGDADKRRPILVMVDGPPGPTGVHSMLIGLSPSKHCCSEGSVRIAHQYPSILPTRTTSSLT